MDPETDSDDAVEEIEINYEEETRFIKINEDLKKKLKNNSEVSSCKIFFKNKKNDKVKLRQEIKEVQDLVNSLIKKHKDETDQVQKRF